MFTFLLVVHALIAASLVGVILMQRSEGGGLGMGGGPAGLMSARGAADFLTRATAVLATAFVLMAFLMAVLATRRDSGGTIDTSLAHQGQVGPITAPTPAGSPIAGIPMAGGTPAATTGAPVPDAATAQALQPASAGLPTAKPAPTPEQAKAQAKLEHDQAQALRKSAPLSLKTIDAPKASSSIGINGVSTGSHAGTTATPAAKAVPTVSAPAPVTTAPTAGSSGNSQ
jgi:protein translocase SecG subunit